MPEDDAMDLNDVRIPMSAGLAARRAWEDDLASYADSMWDHVARGAITDYLRAVPESAELVRMRAISAPSLLDDLNIAISALENYGQHHAWCENQSSHSQGCSCAYKQCVADLYARRQAAEIARDALAALSPDEAAGGE